MPQDYYCLVSPQYYDLHVNYNLAICFRLFSTVLFAIVLVVIIIILTYPRQSVDTEGIKEFRVWKS